MITYDFTPGLLDFALPHAINLAETGETIEQKRIGKLGAILLSTRASDELLTRLP